MGKHKNKKKQGDAQRLPPQLAGMPQCLQQQYHMAMSSQPSKEEIEKRAKLYFGQIRRTPQQVTKSEMQQLQENFGDNWFKNVIEQVKETYIFDDKNEPSIAIKPIFTVEQIRLVLTAGTKLLSSSLNVEDIVVPGTPFKEFAASLPKQYKSKLPQDFNIAHLSQMKPIELQSGSPNIPEHMHLILVGDTHGTFEALSKIFESEGEPGSEAIYLFNGDYVDRGSFSVEVYISLLIFKLFNNKHVYMLRGNHETEAVCTNYSLKEELVRKYKEHGEELFQLFIKSFQALPIAAKINDSYYVVHGGISGWKGFDSDMINQLNRFREPQSSTFMHYQAFDPLNDILWADPTDQTDDIQFNITRGSSIQYGRGAIKRFLKNSKLQFLIRSHQCVRNGFELLHDSHTMTLFSVPNYNEGNIGAYAVLYGLFDENKQPTPQEQKALKDCSPRGLYNCNPTVPLCFIRQFNCSDHASIANQPIMKEFMMKQWEAQMAQVMGMNVGSGKNVM